MLLLRSIVSQSTQPTEMESDAVISAKGLFDINGKRKKNITWEESQLVCVHGISETSMQQ